MSNPRLWEFAVLGAAAMAAVAMLVIPACDSDGGDGSGGNGSWTDDPRCEQECAGTSCPTDPEFDLCVDSCSIALTDTSALCSACMIDNMNVSDCDPNFPVTDCADSCGSAPTVSVGDDDPRCQLACEDAGCPSPAQVDVCESTCRTSIAETSGPCAACLLDNVNSYDCMFTIQAGDDCNDLCN